MAESTELQAIEDIKRGKVTTAVWDFLGRGDDPLANIASLATAAEKQKQEVADLLVQKATHEASAASTPRTRFWPDVLIGLVVVVLVVLGIRAWPVDETTAEPTTLPLIKGSAVRAFAPTVIRPDLPAQLRFEVLAFASAEDAQRAVQLLTERFARGSLDDRGTLTAALSPASTAQLGAGTWAYMGRTTSTPVPLAIGVLVIRDHQYVQVMTGYGIGAEPLPVIQGVADRLHETPPESTTGPNGAALQDYVPELGDLPPGFTPMDEPAA